MSTKPQIAVIGAGLMGHGIAQVFALAGHAVTITDAQRAVCDAIVAALGAHADAQSWLTASSIREQPIQWTETTD